MTPRKMRNLLTPLRAALAALLGVSFLVLGSAAPAMADAPQAVIGMPFGGKWAYASNVNPPWNDVNSSHPSVHANYGANWATDVYASPGTEAKLKVNYASGSASYSVSSVTETKCYAGKRVRVSIKIGGAEVGWVQYDHLNTSITTGTALQNDSVLGTTKNWGNLDCYVVTNDAGVHLHVSMSNTSNYSCYVGHGNPGASLAEGANIGVLGSSNTGARQECSSVPSGGTPGSSKTIIDVKKTVTDGTQQVYSATSSDVYETWWNGSGIHRANLINISQNNIVDIDKLQLPDGTQSLYTAVADGVWETWWRPGASGNSKIVNNLAGVKSVIATTKVENGQLVHLLYVLAADGPYEYWWRDGGDGVHGSRLVNIVNPITFVHTVSASGVSQIYTATAGAVWETWWLSGQGTHTSPVISISQNNIVDIDKMTASDGTQMLYTATASGVWETKWGGSQGNLAHAYIVNNLPGIVDVKKRMETDGTNQLYIATGDRVQEYWWRPGNSGVSTLIHISQGNIRAIDRATYAGYQQLYTAAGSVAWETWWGDGGVHTAPLVNLS